MHSPGCYQKTACAYHLIVEVPLPPFENSWDGECDNECGEQGISLHFPTYTHALCEVKCLPSWYDSQADWHVHTHTHTHTDCWHFTDRLLAFARPVLSGKSRGGHSIPRLAQSRHVTHTHTHTPLSPLLSLSPPFSPPSLFPLSLGRKPGTLL